MSASTSGVRDLLAVARKIEGLPGAIRKANGRALSTAARQGRSRLVQAICAERAFPTRYVSGKLFRRKVSEDAWEIGAVRQPLVPVVVYPHQRIRGGVRGKGYRVRLLPGTGWEVYPQAWALAKHQTRYGPVLFERTGPARYPIEPLLEESVSQVFEWVVDDVMPEVQALYVQELGRQLGQL